MHNLISDDLTNLNEAVMSSDCGEWFLVPKNHVDPKINTTCVSVIVHKCPKWTPELLSPGDKPYEPLGYWVTAESMSVGCKLCDVHPPDIVVHPWLLHNFDTFADTPSYMSQMVSNAISRAWAQMEHQTYYIRDYPCRCVLCRMPIGAEQ